MTQEISNLLFFVSFSSVFLLPGKLSLEALAPRREGKHSSSILLPDLPSPRPQKRALRARGGSRTPISQLHWRGVEGGCISWAGISEQQEARGAVRPSLGFLFRLRAYGFAAQTCLWQQELSSCCSQVALRVGRWGSWEVEKGRGDILQYLDHPPRLSQKAFSQSGASGLCQWQLWYLQILIKRGTKA